MSGTELLGAILELLFGAFTETGTAMGGALSNFASAIFVSTGTTAAISVFGSLIVIFAAISLSLGLFRWVLNFLTSLGARNR